MPRRRVSFLDPNTATLPPLEVRTVTLGINAADLADRTLHRLCEGLYQRILQQAHPFVKLCETVSAEFGVPILQRRVCVSPVDRLAEGHNVDDVLHIAKTLDGAANHVRLDQIAGYLMRVQNGMSRSAKLMIESLPQVLSQTERVQAAVEVAGSASGINIDAVELLGRVIRDTAIATSDRDGVGAAKLSVLANLPAEGPPLSGALSGEGWGDLVVHVSMSAMGPIRHTLQQRLARDPQASLPTLAGDIKAAAFQAARVAELIGREIAQRVGAEFGRVDVSLAPTVRPGQTIAELLQVLGVSAFGSPGTAAALAMIYSAIRSAGGFASTDAAAEANVLLPVLRDAGLVSATEAGSLSLEYLEQLSAVGGLGLDLIPVPGDTDPQTISALIADQLAMAVVTHRPTVVRLIPVPGKAAGDRVTFGRDLGDAVVFPVPKAAAATFINRGGRMPGVR
jgi:uncharacterized protein